jgi:hypothetical protein
MQKIVNELISSSIKGVDVYRWRNATWLIFTEETRWVVELTDEGTLWYNYRFFNDVFKYVSMEVGQQTEKFMIEWANDFFYKDCAHRTILYPCDKARNETPKVLENGIKNLSGTRTLGEHYIDLVVTSGIKEVNQSDSIHRQNRAENVMNKIIKEVRPNRVTVHDEKMDRFYYDPNCTANFTMLTDIVEEGVKKVKPNVVFHGINKSSMSYVPCNGNTTDINIIVEKGVKNIYPDKIPDDYDWSDEFKADNVIQGGIKVIPLPDPSGELRGYSDYYNTKEDRTKPHTEYVKDAIDGGTKL